MLERAYIGITDFMTSDQVRQMLEVLRENRQLYWKRRLGVGVMMSWKTLHDQPTKWTSAFPKKEAIADIFVSDADAYNVLHYADYDGHPVLENLELVRACGGRHLNAIQLDMIWPDPRDIQEFHSRHSEVGIIVQANAKALEAVGDDPTALVARLKDYGDSIACVLLDKSMGRGLGMDAASLLPFARAIVDKLPTLAIAAAGGLGPDTLHLADPLIAEFPGISLDAQGRLRPSGSAMDPIDWTMAALYLKRSAAHFNEVIFDHR